MTSGIFIYGIFAGIAATMTMDAVAIALGKMGLTAGAKGEWVGRWYVGIARGKFVHDNIAASPEQPGEKLTALTGHFAVGIILAIFYVAGAGWLGLSPDLFLLAIGYGFATNVFPWFLVFPSFGFGLLGMKAPPELKLLRSSLINHLSYGFGLWWSLKLILPG